MVFSLTPFFNELDVLEIRLATLDPVVDVHVIAEATLTYSGDPKPLHFLEHEERFAPWRDKIRYVIVDNPPQGKDNALPGTRFQPHKGLAWVRENYQRDALRQGCDGMDIDDLVLLSDVDEIPSPATVEDMDANLERDQVVRCYLPQHVMRLNWRWPDPTTIAVCRFTDGHRLLHDGPQRVREVEVGPIYHDIEGWHLSYMGGPEAVRYKIQHAAHQELNRPEWTNIELIRSRERQGLDMFGRPGRRCQWVPCDTLPEHVRRNLYRFAHLTIDRPRQP